MAKNRGQDWRARSHRFLTSSRAPPFEDLTHLIRDVNPSGRDLPASSERERYLLKARLQSRLIRDYRDALVAERTDDPTIIGLRASGTLLDGCHARVADLDVEAQGWVWRQLQHGGTHGPDPDRIVARVTLSARTASKPKHGTTLLERARAARAEFDYETATTLLRERRTDTAATVELLEILVDHLAQYEDALAHVRLCDPAVASTESVRELAAVAAARAGQVAYAESMLVGLNGPRIGEALSVLAQLAI
jgi:hypothetical protein